MNKITIGEVCNVTKGNIGITKAIPGDYPLVTTGAERLSHNEYQFDCKAVCVPLVSSTGHGHASINRIHYQEGKFALGSILAAITSKDENVLNSKFLYIYLSVLKDRILVPLMQGTANVSMSVKVINKATIDLPSIEKQKKIVETYQHILPLWESLDNLYQNQQSLLNKMRESILQFAVEGKLVEQDQNDEPAELLLESIKAENERLIRERKIRKSQPLQSIKEDEVPYGIPESWEWARLGHLVASYKDDIVDGPFGSNLKASEYVDQGVPIIRIQNIQRNNFLDKNIRFITPEKAKELSRHSFKQGDIVINKLGDPVGKAAIVPDFLKKGIIVADIVRMRVNENIFDKHYLQYSINSQTVINQFSDLVTGITRQRVNLTKIRNLVVPIPPLDEQKRIVAKINQLMSLCDKLEEKIMLAQSDSDVLMEVAVNHLLEA
jgi:type I restriction enzyme S subunit